MAARTFLIGISAVMGSLAMVKRIAVAHAAEVWVEPNTPRGNSFNLRIPNLKVNKRMLNNNPIPLISLLGSILRGERLE